MLQRRRIVDPVPGHPHDMSDGLKRLDDLVFVLGKHAPESIGALHRLQDALWERLHLDAPLEDVAGDEQMRAHSELAGDLIADGDIVARHHFDV